MASALEQVNKERGQSMRKLAIALTVLAVLALLVLAVLQRRASRELILQTNGLPLANLKGNIMPASVAGPPIVPTSTDSNGRLDLQGVPRGTEQINVSLWDGAGNIRIRNTLIELPTNDVRIVVDFRDGRTIRTTTTTYADFILFKLTSQKVVIWEKVGEKTKSGNTNTPSRNDGENDQSPL